MHAQWARPGLHCILIFDPKTQQIYKKTLTLNQKDKAKEYLPQRQLQHDGSQLVDLQENPDMFATDEDLYQKQFLEDIQHPEFKPYRLIDDAKTMHEFVMKLRCNYQSVCQVYSAIMFGDIVDLEKQEFNVKLSGLQSKFFPNLKMSKTTFDNEFAEACFDQTDSDGEKVPKANKMSQRSEFCMFILRLLVKLQHDEAQSQQVFDDMDQYFVKVQNEKV